MPRPHAGRRCQISTKSIPQLPLTTHTRFFEQRVTAATLWTRNTEPAGPSDDDTSWPSMAPNMSLHSVHAILILSTDTAADSSRLFAKYYTPPHSNPSQPTPPQPYSTLKEQKAFEKGLLEKTAKQTSDVILYDNKVVVFKMESDVMLYVVGSAEENEILLYNVILALRDTLSILLKCVVAVPQVTQAMTDER